MKTNNKRYYFEFFDIVLYYRSIRIVYFCVKTIKEQF